MATSHGSTVTLMSQWKIKHEERGQGLEGTKSQADSGGSGQTEDKKQ